MRRLAPLRSYAVPPAGHVHGPTLTFGHFLERREAFLNALGTQQRSEAPREAQSRLFKLLTGTGSTIAEPTRPPTSPPASSAVSATAGLGEAGYGPNLRARTARDLFTLQQMMACSVHLGHSTSRWHPKMAPFILGERAGIHIINLDKTLIALRQACNVVKDIASRGGILLFVGTGATIQRLTYECAQDCGQHYINIRWIGGTMTNRAQVLRNDRLAPDLLILLDPVTNDQAVLEALSCNIPTVGICDTNCDPSKLTYPVPANDDAFSSVELIARTLSLAAQEGRKTRTLPLKSADIVDSATKFIDRVFTNKKGPHPRHMS